MSCLQICVKFLLTNDFYTCVLLAKIVTFADGDDKFIVENCQYLSLIYSQPQFFDKIPNWAHITLQLENL